MTAVGQPVGIDLAAPLSVVADPAGMSTVAAAVGWLGPRAVAGRAAADAATRAGSVLLTGFLDLLPVPAEEWPARGWEAETDPVAATRDFLAALLGVDAAARPVVIAVPDSWRDGAGGRRARDRLAVACADLPAARPVSASVLAAAAVAAATPAGSRLLLVCVIAGNSVDVALCELDKRGARLIDGESHPGPAADAFVTALTCGAYTAAHGHGPDRPRLAALHEALADSVRRDAGRAAAVLTAADRVDRWRDARAYRMVDGQGSYRLSAGLLLAAYHPVAATIRAAVTSLLGRRGDLVALTPAGELGSVAVGLPCVLPAAQWDVADAAAAAAGVRPEPVAVERPSLAVACGAALVAAGRVTATERHTYTVTLHSRQIRAGLLVSADVPLAAAGALAASTTEEPVVLRVEAGTPGVVTLELTPPDPAQPRSARLVVPPDLSPGGYRASVRLGRGGAGALLLQPYDGAPARVLPWEEIE